MTGSRILCVAGLGTPAPSLVSPQFDPENLIIVFAMVAGLSVSGIPRIRFNGDSGTTAYAYNISDSTLVTSVVTLVGATGIAGAASGIALGVTNATTAFAAELVVGNGPSVSHAIMLRGTAGVLDGSAHKMGQMRWGGWRLVRSARNTGSASSVPVGYDNIANWPDGTNRPVYNSGTNTLTWIGPIAGGPSTSNDVQQSLVLTASGDITTSSNGQVISGLAVTGNITIAHNNVIIKRCYVKWAAGFEQINISGQTGCVVEDCEVDGNNPNGVSGNGGFEGMGLNFAGGTIVRRCNFHGMENAFSNQFGGSPKPLIIDEWVHSLSGADNDGIEFNSTCTAGDVEHCTFDYNSSLGFTNSGVNVTNVSGGVTGIIINNTRFMNFPAFGVCDGDSTSSGESMAVTNCGFFNCVNFRRDTVTCSPNSGNYVMATANATSGTPTNGTGAI